jgi:NAD(P)H-hydrate epimerase
MNSREDTGFGTTDAPAKHGGGCCSGHSHAHPHTHPHEHDHAEDAGGCCGGEGGGRGEGCCGGKSAAAEQVLVFSRKQIRELDRVAVEEYAIPSILLMENAARGVASVILEGLQGVEEPSVLVVCGPGNNGGDGLAVARHLANRGVKVAIVLGAPETRCTGDALTNLRIAKKMELPIIVAERTAGEAIDAAIARIGEPVVVADALFGTGLDRPATGIAADLIVRMNAMKAGGATLVSIDVPSGLDCDTGEPAKDETGSGPAVQADLTIALAGIKAGYMTQTAQAHVGELAVVDIGAPRALMARLGHPLGAPGKGCCGG